MAMGIRRLKGFVDCHFTGWQRRELKGHLVIDGYNIRHYLNRCDWSNGGQFGEFREHVFSFYQKLLRSGIIPIVVLDGIDYTGQKWSTILKREKERIRQVHKELNVANRKPEVRSPGIFPTLGSDVYVQALADLGIEYVVADGEADDALVNIANYYNCPVLSSDSDFFIYNLSGGYVRMDKMNTRNYPITAEVYYYHAFCEQFHFQDESVRLIIPALVGNDFWTTNVEDKDFNLLLEEEVEPGSHALLQFVKFASSFDSLESFVDRVPHLPYLRSGRKLKIIQNCRQSIEIYNSSRVFQIRDIIDDTNLRTFKGDRIPLWTLRNYRRGQISKESISMLVIQKHALHLFIDDTTRESSVLVSRPIRKCIYGILGCDCVAEHFRVEQHLSSEEILSFESVDGHPLPSLCDMPKLSIPQREGLLYLILGCDEGVFQALEGRWKLALAATVFWNRIARPPPHLVESLLLSFLACSGHAAPLRWNLVTSTEFRNSSEWMRNLHWFAQWQSCYKDAIGLNKVLMLPVPVTCPSQLYNGKLVTSCTIPSNFDRVMSSFRVNSRLFWSLLGVVLPQLVRHQSRHRHAHHGHSGNQGRSTQQGFGGSRASTVRCGDWKVESMSSFGQHRAKHNPPLRQIEKPASNHTPPSNQGQWGKSKPVSSPVTHMPASKGAKDDPTFGRVVKSSSQSELGEQKPAPNQGIPPSSKKWGRDQHHGGRPATGKGQGGAGRPTSSKGHGRRPTACQDQGDVDHPTSNQHTGRPASRGGRGGRYRPSTSQGQGDMATQGQESKPTLYRSGGARHTSPEQGDTASPRFGHQSRPTSNQGRGRRRMPPASQGQGTDAPTSSQGQGSRPSCYMARS